MLANHRIGVVVLAYMVEDQIEHTIETQPAFVDEVYVVDDGSTDATAERIAKLATGNVHLIRHEENRGPGAGLRSGYQAALADGMDIVAKVDGDGQMESAGLESLITPVVNGEADYTKGNRLSSPEHRRSMPRFRLLGNRILTWQTRIASGYWHLDDAQNGYTAISRRALETINLDLCPYYGYLNDLLIQLHAHGFRLMDVPMPAKYGGEKSSIRLRLYVPRVSKVLLAGFFWRLRMEYRARRRRSR